MAITPTPNLGGQDFFSTTLSSNVLVSDTVINLNAVPTATEGFLVIDPNNASTREIIFYQSKTSSAVTCPDAIQGSARGIGGTTVQAHNIGVTVELRNVWEYYKYLQSGQSWAVGSIGATAFANGWAPGLATPNTVTALGNRSYNLIFNGTDITPTVSNGMRLKLTRTVGAPVQCTSLNGTTQFFSNAAPAGMTFTDTWTATAWVKLSSYSASPMSIISRTASSSDGWNFYVDASGRLTSVFYGAGTTYKGANSYQSVPLNKWVHVAVSHQASTNTATLYIDGVVVPGTTFVSGGTPPTSVTQGTGALQVGASNSASFFPGKIAQVGIYSAVISGATILASMHQTLVGTETSLISAYSFNNSITDLSANANNLTANGSAVATALDSPYGGQADGTISSTVDYGIITKTAFSTNTTLTVQVPEGCTIPTTGGVSAVSYSTQKVPYGFPAQRGKWMLQSIMKTSNNVLVTVNNFANVASWQMGLATGEWKLRYAFYSSWTNGAGATYTETAVGISTSTSSFSSDLERSLSLTVTTNASSSQINTFVTNQTDYGTSTLTTVYLIEKAVTSNQTIYVDGATGGPAVFEAELAYL